jgi:hypothetical protein
MSSLIAMWSPVTFDFGLIQAPLERVLAEFQSWHKSIGIEYTRTDITSSLADAFTSLLPLSHSKMRRLFLATHSDWVACFQNGIAGSDPFPAMHYLARKMGVLGMRVCCTPDNALYPATIWEVYADESLGSETSLGYRRVLSAANDGGRWTFDESGERFPFEQTERYTLRRKRDRFSREMLRDYLRHFGVELFSDDFLRVDRESPAVRLQQVTKVWQTPEFTLQEVVAGVPWQKSDRVI